MEFEVFAVLMSDSLVAIETSRTGAAAFAETWNRKAPADMKVEVRPMRMADSSDLRRASQVVE